MSRQREIDRRVTGGGPDDLVECQLLPDASCVHEGCRDVSEYTELAQHLETVHYWRQPREFFNLNQLRRIHSFFVSCPDRPAAPVPTEMVWTAHERASLTDQATNIVDWINTNGGEAKYEHGGTYGPESKRTLPHIAVRIKGGDWAYAKPGQVISRTEEQFVYHREGWSGGTRCREFRISSICSHTVEEGCTGHGDF